ncbi:hypothetical protein TNCV_3652331 [Trichonephila clavipes]|nr:hypothetical protein TNCV_3652331 [Trichonephila clavipes]
MTSSGEYPTTETHVDCGMGTLSSIFVGRFGVLSMKKWYKAVKGCSVPYLETPACCSSSWTGSSAMPEKDGNHLVPGPDYMVDALKLSNQAPRVSEESKQMCLSWRSPDGP